VRSFRQRKPRRRRIQQLIRLHQRRAHPQPSTTGPNSEFNLLNTNLVAPAGHRFNLTSTPAEDVAMGRIETSVCGGHEVARPSICRRCTRRSSALRRCTAKGVRYDEILTYWTGSLCGTGVGGECLRIRQSTGAQASYLDRREWKTRYPTQFRIPANPRVWDCVHVTFPQCSRGLDGLNDGSFK
jgi:hypothetical protein